MSHALLPETQVPTESSTAQEPRACGECLGAGGWFRYEPALEPAPGLIYLCCLRCRGSGQSALARG
jgi:hypothetical protein